MHLRHVVSFLSFCRFCQKARETDIHTLPDPRAGERILFQQVSHATTSTGDSPEPLFDGTTNKNLVSKPPNEVEKGEYVIISCSGSQEKNHLTSINK